MRKTYKNIIYSEVPSDLLVVLMWITAVFIITAIPMTANSIIRTIFGIPMILFIPGYLLVAVLFPKKGDLDNTGRIALSLCLSLVTIPLLGLILDSISQIDLIPILIILCIYAIIFIFIATYRRGQLPENEKFSVSFGQTYDNIVTNIISPKNKIDGVLTVILILVIVAAIGMAYFALAAPKIGEKFTEFYVLDPVSKIDSYQTDLKINSLVTYPIGIINHEYAYTNDQNVLDSKELSLNHGDAWKDDMVFVPENEGTNMRLEFWLFKDNDFTEPYRKLYLQINSIKQ
jgi:uncharacterized membrane protein